MGKFKCPSRLIEVSLTKHLLLSECIFQILTPLYAIANQTAHGIFKHGLASTQRSVTWYSRYCYV